MNLKGKKILVTDSDDFVGAHVVKQLRKRGVEKIVTPKVKYFEWHSLQKCRQVLKGIEIVIHTAGNTGGLGYNQQFPGTLLYDNLLIGTQLLEAARQTGVEKFVAVGSVSCYPKNTPVPFREDDLWNGYPDETNAPYGLAKKMLLVQSQAYRKQFGFNSIFLMPANPYGPGDYSDPKSSHVIPALIAKYVEVVRTGKSSVTLWGSGKATREFIYVDDLAEGIVLATEKYDKEEAVNIGSGMEVSIKGLAQLISTLVGYKGKTLWDKTKPDGQPRRSLDSSRAKLEFGFVAKTDFRKGLQTTIKAFLKSP